MIFICDFDPFGKRKYCYTFTNTCRETENADLKDGSSTIFLSTCGTNETEVPMELVNFLKFVKADLRESMMESEDSFVRRLQESIRTVKASREMEERFMIFEELLRDERAEGKAEGKAEAVLELLEELGTVSTDLQDKIMEETNLTVLKTWLKLAAKVDSVEQFVQNM